MVYNQMYALINDINDQMWGKDAVDTHDLSGIISLYETLNLDSSVRDKYLNKLIDRIGKTRIRTLDLEVDFPSLFYDEIEFGAIIQKITVNPFSAIQASEFEVGENDFTPTFADIHKPENIFVSYATDCGVWKFFVTIPDELFQSAFTSEANMSAFIDAIVGQLSDSMTLAINNLSRTAINNFVAEKVLRGNGIVNLVTLYNEAFGYTGLNAKTADECLVSEEFYRYSSTVIRNLIKYINEPSVLYNVGDTSGNPILRATARDNMHVIFLTHFVSSFDAFLRSSTFHDELVKLPFYTETGYFQGNKGANGEINTFDVNSTINVIPSSQKSVETAGERYAVIQKGVVGILADREAIAVGFNKRRSGSFTNTIDGYTNLSSTAKKSYINDLSENGIIILCCDEDEIATPSISLDESTLTFANSSADTKTLVATTTPSDATVTWKTSKSAVATVSEGVVDPAGTGTCTITAEITVGGKKYTATCAVTVG